MQQKPTDTANDKQLICLGFVSIIKLKAYTAKTNKNCFLFPSNPCRKPDVSPCRRTAKSSRHRTSSPAHKYKFSHDHPSTPGQNHTRVRLKFG